MGTGNDFLNSTSKAQEIISRINKCNGIKLKVFRTAMESIKNMKREPREQEKIIASYSSDK